jgi:hypothetical protein
MKKKIIISIRENKPEVCINCGNKLHNKSEFYCSQKCFDNYIPMHNDAKPEFLSKWKIRKRRAQKDPFSEIRKQTRHKTRQLVIEGKIKKKNCLICDSKEVIAHHEDYSNPFNIIWLCEKHHKEYHQKIIKLFNNTLEWNDDRLTKNLQPILQKKRDNKLKTNNISSKHN